MSIKGWCFSEETGNSHQCKTNMHSNQGWKFQDRFFQSDSYSKIENVFINSQKSGTLVIRIGKNKKYFHVCNYLKDSDEGYGAELTKGKTMSIGK